MPGADPVSAGIIAAGSLGSALIGSGSGGGGKKQKTTDVPATGPAQPLGSYQQYNPIQFGMQPGQSLPPGLTAPMSAADYRQMPGALQAQPGMQAGPAGPSGYSAGMSQVSGAAPSPQGSYIPSYMSSVSGMTPQSAYGNPQGGGGLNGLALMQALQAGLPGVPNPGQTTMPAMMPMASLGPTVTPPAPATTGKPPKTPKNGGRSVALGNTPANGTSGF